MGVIQTATNPWGQTVPIHIAFYLMWVAAIGGLAFLMVHAIYVQFIARKEAHAGAVAPGVAAGDSGEESRGTAWPRACFTGSWRWRCSRS